MQRRGLTVFQALVAVLAVAVVIALLIGILLPSLGGHGPPARRTRCMANLKLQGTAFFIYSSEFGGKWPSSTSGAALTSLCQQTPETRDAFAGAMLGISGMTGATVQKVFYCPINAAQDPAKLWDAGGVSTWGYVWMNDRGTAGTALPATIPARTVPLQYVANLDKVRSTGGVMLALDVIVTDTDVAPLNFTPKGVAVDFGTNHPGTNQSCSANVVFVDGHVENRKFAPAAAVALKQPGGGYFWFPGP
jgi:prepilin-type processing-associated H-X9-DG protein